MKFILLAFFCTLTFTASAQFWKHKPKTEDHTQFPVLATEHTHQPILFNTALHTTAIHEVQLQHINYNLQLAEDMILKEAKHNMRFRIYNLASYNFSDLAALYVRQNRFSEAKWYLLQSNQIARQEDDTKHTLDNLLALATIKTQIGELALAKTDLQEAHDMATAKGMQQELTEIDKRINYLQTNKTVSPKLIVRYADAVEAENNKPKIN
jgi:hypothetical protein